MKRTFVAIMLLSVSICQASNATTNNTNASAQNNTSPIVAIFKTFVDDHNVIAARRADGSTTFNVPVSYVFNGKPIYTGAGNTNSNTFRTTGGASTAVTAQNNPNRIVNTLAFLNPSATTSTGTSSQSNSLLSAGQSSIVNNQGVVRLNSDVLSALLALNQLASSSDSDVINGLNNSQSLNNADFNSLLTNASLNLKLLRVNVRTNAQNAQEFYDVLTGNALTLAEVQQKIVAALSASTTTNTSSDAPSTAAVRSNQSVNTNTTPIVKSQNVAANQNASNTNTASNQNTAANNQNAAVTNQNTAATNQNTAANNQNTAATNQSTPANNNTANNTGVNTSNSTTVPVADTTPVSNTNPNNTATVSR